jgi:hypothetical protein
MIGSWRSTERLKALFPKVHSAIEQPLASLFACHENLLLWPNSVIQPCFVNVRFGSFLPVGATQGFHDCPTVGNRPQPVIHQKPARSHLIHNIQKQYAGEPVGMMGACTAGSPSFGEMVTQINGTF